MSLIKKLAAALLTLSMILSVTACADTSWAAKSDDFQVRAGIYIYYTINAYYEAQSKLTEDQKDLFSAKIEDKDAKTWIKDNATKKLKDYIAIENKFDELGLELSESDNNKIKISADSVWNQNGELFEKNGINAQSITDIFANSYKSDLVFKKYYGTDGLEEVSEKDLEAYYNDNNVRVKYIAIQLKDGEGNLFKSADKAKAMEMAEDYKSRATVDNFDALIKEYNDYYAEEVKKAADSSSSSSEVDSSSSAEADEYVNEHIIKKEDTTPSKKVVEAIFSKSKVNTPVIIEDDEVYYVVMKLDLLERTDLLDSSRESLLYSMKSEEFNKMIDDWSGAINFTKNEDAYNRYDPEKIVLE